MLIQFINILLGGGNMVEIYATLIINGRKKFSQVPVKLQEAVKETLEILGLDENGNPV